jgi:hypothetical protein
MVFTHTERIYDFVFIVNENYLSIRLPLCVAGTGLFRWNVFLLPHPYLLTTTLTTLRSMAPNLYL